jgi:hypothetical protein
MDLIKRKVAEFDALPPAEKARLREAQQRSWCSGEAMLKNPDMTWEQAEALHERAANRREG